MMRLFCFLLVAAFVIASVIASDRAKPMVIDARSPGPWAFEKADFPICARVHLPPLRPTPPALGHAPDEKTQTAMPVV